MRERETENCCTGKSSLTVQFVEGHFVESYYPTIENTFSRVIKHKGQDFATEIVDTAGQVRATSIHQSPISIVRCLNGRGAWLLVAGGRYVVCDMLAIQKEYSSQHPRVVSIITSITLCALLLVLWALG